ncbi:peptidase S10, serine carboxypeptidase [Dunaliella salina]|uniref:Carboxypeptidase n=1 Tax=Dunaliella salina TaxID=3046 RepID=A0ABQ7GLR8_DUNSA|nr:peptidase S10, serine carboxypeptidase [Dunaliella salina]|eukprot:KAF5835512.1 peptidase S10, serine carboxypeptidase [Dunaliella salina]
MRGGGTAGLGTGAKGSHGDPQNRPCENGGYVSLSEDGIGKHLYWYMAESESKPAEDPVVLWLNGGPGCSSFDGFVYEHGPFLFNYINGGKGYTLRENPHSWNKIANMMYLDSPAGVGLSYSNRGTSDYFTNDDTTAADAEAMLRKWFADHPQFQGNEFFISGESYAGVYVPNLAKAVVEGNLAGKTPYINLKGYMVGNGCTDLEVDGNALPLFAAGKSLISQRDFVDLNAACSNNIWNSTRGSQCDKDLAGLVEDIADLNIYDILEPCFTGSPQEGASNDHSAPLPTAHMPKVLATHGRRWPALGSTPHPGRVHNWAHLGLTPPCTDVRVAMKWLNDPEVRQAIHAAPISAIGQWSICSDMVLYERTIPSLIPIHKDLTQKHGLRALIYSGDHDAAVPHTGSEAWTSALGFPVTSRWHPWYFSNQVAGYATEYTNLTYATVLGAGHMVPQNKPREALEMFERFLSKKTI